MSESNERLSRRAPSREPLLPQRVYDHLENAIIDRTYPPGTHLKEDQVAVELGVSRTPVREAFRMLERAGWLEVHPHAGAYVRHPSIGQVSDVFELRQCLEEWGIELAAVRATEPQKLQLRDIIDAGMAAVGRHDVETMARLNSVFHTRLAAATGNAQLQGILENLAKQIRWHFSVVAEEIGEQSWVEHGQILEAIEQREPHTAKEIISRHIGRTREVLLRRLFSTDDLSSHTESPLPVDGASSSRPLRETQ